MITAKLNYLRISPRKTRLVVGLIRGLPVIEAERQLIFLTKRSARSVLKLLRSACANARHNHSLEKESLYIDKIFVDQGPTLKRWMPRAMGRATPIMKRTSHLTIVLGAKKGTVVPSKDPAQEQARKKIEKPKGDASIGPDVLPEESTEKTKSQEVFKENKEEGKNFRPSGRRPKKKEALGSQTFDRAKKIFRRKSI